jgi:5-methyltetrahydropteroyltriglutamate--homocysteine methyltransferase
MFRADQVGSLLRPQALLDARHAWEAGQMPLAQLRAVEDRSIENVLALQRKTGISVLSDGEFRRSAWGSGFLDSLEGLQDDSTHTVQGSQWHGSTAQLASSAIGRRRMVAGKVRVKEPFTQGEARFLKSHAGAPFKVTLPSPTMFLRLFVRGVTDRFYENEAALLEDFVGIYQREIDSLLEIGVPYIQLDSLRYMHLMSELESGAGHADELRRDLERTIKADNLILGRAKHPGVTRAMHMCRGNNRSAWFGEGSYESIAEMLFSSVDTDRFLLEFDDERSGGFEPLRFIPKNKTVVLGLITSKTGKLESLEGLRRRVDEAARYVAIENLAISPQCGFASTHLGNLLSEEEESRKLELVAEAARVIWGT